MIVEFDDCTFAGSPVASMDRSRGVPHGSPLEVHLYPDQGADDSSDELMVPSVSFSKFGVGMELPHEICIGTVYNIEIDVGGQKLQSHVRITSCDPVADGMYRAGGEFC